MRVLFTSLAFPGHLFPQVPLAWALRAAGHDVRVAVEPGFVPYVTRAGLPAVPVGHDVNAREIWKGVGVAPDAATSMEEHRRRRARRGMLMFQAAATAAVPNLMTVAREFRADLIVYEPRAYAGVIAAQRLGVPAVRYVWGPDYTSMHHDAEAEALAELWASHGLTKVGDLGTATIDPCPAAIQVPIPGHVIPVRYVPYNGPGLLPPSLHDGAGPPRICVTWGTSFRMIAGHLAPARLAIGVAARHDPDLVVAAPSADAALLGDLPHSVRVAESLPLSLILPSCDLLIHQGGAGTTLTALTSGVPQVIVPYAADTFLNADAINSCGAGLAVPLAEADDAALDAAVTQVLSDESFTAAAREVAAENSRRPAPAAIVAELAEHAARAA